MVALSSPNDVLIFWFGNEVLNRQSGCMEDVSYIDGRMGVWFAGKSNDFDEVQKRCTDLVRKAGSGLLFDPLWGTADGCLAKVIILDQFTRCIFRGTPLAFQYDQVASALVNHIINSGWMDSYSSIERFFLGVAVQHSENLALQQVGVDIARNVAAGAPAEVVQYFANIKGYPMEHYEVIERFGRFPSRNLALVSFESLIQLFLSVGEVFSLCVLFLLKGRESTAEEIAWMASPECPSWAKSQLPTKS